MNQLFDPASFPSPQDQDRKPRAVAPPTTAPAPEPWVDPWVVVFTRRGPLPYTHLPVDPARLEVLRRTGAMDRTSLMTVCGQVGWPVDQHRSGVGSMVACPDCRAGS